MGSLSLQYIAGLFDGEGSISITRVGELQISLSNTHEGVVILLHEQYGGCKICQIRPKTSARRPQFQWVLKARKALAFLENIRPWLVIKSEQADLAIMFQTKKKWCRNGRYQPTPPEELAWRAEQAFKMRKLNRPLQAQEELHGQSD